MGRTAFPEALLQLTRLTELVLGHNSLIHLPSGCVTPFPSQPPSYLSVRPAHGKRSGPVAQRTSTAGPVPPRRTREPDAASNPARACITPAAACSSDPWTPRPTHAARSNLNESSVNAQVWSSERPAHAGSASRGATASVPGGGCTSALMCASPVPPGDCRRLQSQPPASTCTSTQPGVRCALIPLAPSGGSVWKRSNERGRTLSLTSQCESLPDAKHRPLPRTHIPQVSCLVELTVLMLGGNKLKQLPKGLGKLRKLQARGCFSERGRGCRVGGGSTSTIAPAQLPPSLLSVSSHGPVPLCRLFHNQGRQHLVLQMLAAPHTSLPPARCRS